MFNPEEYMISIRQEDVEGELLYVARVFELPDVLEYADSSEFARELVMDTISTSMQFFIEQGLPFPEPMAASLNNESATGRITLRLAKSLHIKAIKYAQCDDVSLNQFISNAVSVAIGKRDENERMNHALYKLMAEMVDAPRLYWMKGTESRMLYKWHDFAVSKTSLLPDLKMQVFEDYSVSEDVVSNVFSLARANMSSHAVRWVECK